jgi:hypothetical protein
LIRHNGNTKEEKPFPWQPHGDLHFLGETTWNISVISEYSSQKSELKKMQISVEDVWLLILYKNFHDGQMILTCIMILWRNIPNLWFFNFLQFTQFSSISKKKCKCMVPIKSIWDQKIILWHTGFWALQKLWCSDSTLQNLPNSLAFLQQWMQIAARLRDRRSGRCTQGHSLGYFGGFALQYQQVNEEKACLSKTYIFQNAFTKKQRNIYKCASTFCVSLYFGCTFMNIFYMWEFTTVYQTWEGDEK